MSKGKSGEERSGEKRRGELTSGLCPHLCVLVCSLSCFLRYLAISVENVNSLPLAIIDDPRTQLNLVIDTQLQKIYSEKELNIIVCTTHSLLKITSYTVLCKVQNVCDIEHVT